MVSPQYYITKFDEMAELTNLIWHKKWITFVPSFPIDVFKLENEPIWHDGKLDSANLIGFEIIKLEPMFIGVNCYSTPLDVMKSIRCLLKEAIDALKRCNKDNLVCYLGRPKEGVLQIFLLKPSHGKISKVIKGIPEKWIFYLENRKIILNSLLIGGQDE